MKLKIVIKSIFGATLFEYEKENNIVHDQWNIEKFKNK